VDCQLFSLLFVFSSGDSIHNKQFFKANGKLRVSQDVQEGRWEMINLLNFWGLIIISTQPTANSYGLKYDQGQFLEKTWQDFKTQKKELNVLSPELITDI
jgi:hypothetical protein